MQVLKRKRLEKHIERDVVKHVHKELGGITRKMNGLGFNSWPDRLVLLPGCSELWIEFKRPGKGVTEQQSYLHEELRKQGREVWVEDDSKMCIAKLDRWMVKQVNKGLMRRHKQ